MMGYKCDVKRKQFKEVIQIYISRNIIVYIVLNSVKVAILCSRTTIFL